MRRALFLGCAFVACGGATVHQGSNSDGGVVDPVCSALGAPVAVAANDELGYPPYSMRACRLAYVDASSHDLVLRDLTTGAETTLDKAENKPRRPSVASDVVAWEATLPNASFTNDVVRVAYAEHVATLDLPSGYSSAREPAVAKGVVVFSAFKGDPNAAFSADSDVFAYDLATKKLSPVATGPAQQRFAAVSDSMIAVTDFSEDPKGYFSGDGSDLADIGVYDRAAQAYTVRKHPGKDAFPAIVSGDVLAYLHWGDVHPEPKLEAYSVYSARIAGDPSTDVRIADVTKATRFLRPSASAGRIEWVTIDQSAESILWRSDLMTAPVAALDLRGETMLASVSLETGTLVARNGTLVVVAR
jgi:hypothetical protein